MSTADNVVAHSDATLRAGSKSFAAAARLFDTRTREDAVMLYAWCRYADDVIDGQTLGHEQEADFREGQLERLETLRDDTLAALREGRADDPHFVALMRVVRNAAIPERHPLELLHGFEMDVEERHYDTLSDTLDYCYHVAGVVGVMMAMIMGARDEAVLDRASDLGIALQLTNIARDVIDDAEAGRVYLPADLLAAEGLDQVDARNPSQRAALHRTALRLLDIAEPYYRSSRAGVAELPWRSAWAVASASRVYRAIGTRLRREGPSAWDRRVSTSLLQKLGLVTRALGDVIVSRFRRSGERPRGLYARPR